MCGDMVIVRQYGGIPAIRRVLDESGVAVYITNDEQLRLFNAGRSDILSVGFPRKDVFRYDPELAGSMDELWRNGKWDWSKLMPW